VNPSMPETLRRRVYLMRHGQVAYWPDPAAAVHHEEVVLTAEGVEQARAAGRALAGVAFDLVVTSGLGRAVHTAELVTGSSSSGFEVEPDFEELRAGEVDVIADEDVEEAFLGAFRGPAPPGSSFLGGETVASMVARVSAAYARLCSRPWETALVVAHGGVNRAILSHVLAGPGTFLGHLEQSAGCFNVIDDGYVRAVNVTPYDLAHSSTRETTLEEMLHQYREYRRARSTPGT
jgi:broad specificity phosphatase PhoE